MDNFRYAVEQQGDDLIIRLKPSQPLTSEIKITFSVGAKKRRIRRKVRRAKRTARKQQAS